jgi:DNA primase
METLEAAVKSYEAAMTVEAAQYLVGRGLTQETVLTHRLGVVADPIPAHERYRGWLAIPYLVGEQPVRVRFRCIQSHDCKEFSHGKYGQPTGETLLTYGVNDIHEAGGEIHVTEGEFDRLILKQCGLYAIAFPGASTFRGYHGRMLAGFNRVYVWGDPDQAGAEFTTKVVNRLPRSGRGVQLRVGDVTDTYLAGGVEAIYDLVKAA